MSSNGRTTPVKGVNVGSSPIMVDYLEVMEPSKGKKDSLRNGRVFLYSIL